MKPQRPCETMTYWYDQLWNCRNPAPIDTLLADDFVLHGHNGDKITKQGFREFYDVICNGFSETHMEILDQLEDGNSCAIRVNCSATLASTGKSSSFQMMSMVRFNNEGKVIEAWDTMDWYGYLTRIGALPVDTLQMVIGEGRTFTTT